MRVVLSALIALTACAAPPRAEPGSISAPASVDPRAIERVTRVAHDVRAWLTERYGPPRSGPAAIRLVPDPHWFSEEEPASLQVPVAWELSDPSMAVDDPPTILIAPCFGSYARPGALARWIFHVEWTQGLAPWLREGLADTVAAALAAETHPDGFDATLDGLLPDGSGAARAFAPDPERLVALDVAGARASADAARLVSAGTDGGEPALVRAVLDAPPSSVEEVAAFTAKARARAARSPTFARLVRGLEHHPRALSTTALLEAATPPAGTSEDELPDAARDRPALEAKLAELARSPDAQVRRLAVYGLARLGARPAIIADAAHDPSIHVRIAALGARARSGQGGRALAVALLELAKEGPVEEAPGRPLPSLALFDALTGYREPPPREPRELGIALEGAPGVPARYRAIEEREAFLRGTR